MNKWTSWYASLPEHTKQYLNSQAIWHDRDLLWVSMFAFVVGIFVGRVM